MPLQSVRAVAGKHYVAVHDTARNAPPDTVAWQWKRVELGVSDKGYGIAPADQERIFERFYRVDPARSRATGGTGLGLSIVKHVAATHGGEVRVWSLEGQGSTFTLSLPRSQQEEFTP